MSGFQPWKFRTGADFDEEARFIGYRVVATDEEVGEVTDVINTTDHRAFVIDTGAWVVGQRILLPVGTVEYVDHVARQVKVDRSATEIRDAPPYEVASDENPEYRNRLTHYYCDLYSDRHSAGVHHPSEPGVSHDSDISGDEDDDGSDGPR
jgi:hypothetical protein